MNFSWLCSSLFHNFSETIEKCFETPTKYLNFEEEQKFVLNGLRVVLEAELKLEKLYPKLKPIFRRPLNPLALKPSSIAQNIKIILEEQKTDKFIDEKNYIYEKVQDFEVKVVKIKTPFLKKIGIRSFSPQISNKISDEKFLISQTQNSIEASRTFQSKARSLSPRLKGILEVRDDRKFYLTDDFLNFSGINECENEANGKSKKVLYLPALEKVSEIECSKILMKSKYEKEKLLQFYENKNFDKQNQNILPRLTKNLGTHTRKEIDLMERQQQNFIEEFNKFYNRKFLFLRIFFFLLFLSKKLARVLKGMKIMEFSYENSEKIFTHKEDLIKQLQDLEEKIKESEEMDQEKSFEKHRLLKILKICQINLIQNKEYADVFYFFFQNRN